MALGGVHPSASGDSAVAQAQRATGEVLATPLSCLSRTELGEQVMQLIRSEMKQRGTAAIVVTHDERITHYCDRTVHIVDGRLAA